MAIGAQASPGARTRQRQPLRALRLALQLVLVGASSYAPSPAARSDGAAPHAAAIVIRDDRGITHRFARPPQRIVSLVPSLTESLAALGATDRLVGVDRFSNWPPELHALPRLGGLEDGLIESIARLEPEVVLVSASARTNERLAALGLTVVQLQAQSHADVQYTLARLAQLLGRPQAAGRLWHQIQAQLTAAAARVPLALRQRSVYFEVSGGPYAAGASSFIGETLSRLGLINIAAPELGPFPKLNPEFVVRAQPWIVLGDARDIETMSSRPGWASLPALRHRRRCGFEGATYDMLVRPGPRLGEAAVKLADCLAMLPP